MSATRRIFSYKCKKGHLTTKTFPLGTRFDDNDETECAECLKQDVLETAYLVYAEVSDGKLRPNS